ncbi:VOC family protein [Nocardia sp. NPDC049707]|uniref:VOC family protein n=1 Tax=Nocardia sp. NPDC049707 TaxID=3154735 RepID=UPI00342BC061
MDMKLEVVVLPVADVDRAKTFYTERLGFRLDADFPVDDGYRVVQVTPPGSACSIIFGTGVTTAAPGTSYGLHLIVTDIEAAVAELAERGIAVDGPFRDATGVFHHAGSEGRVPGADPQRRSYGSFAAFTDPDGNGWFLQEITQRAPGR